MHAILYIKHHQDPHKTMLLKELLNTHWGVILATPLGPAQAAMLLPYYLLQGKTVQVKDGRGERTSVP